MSSKPHPHDPLIFAWQTRDHSTWHLVAAMMLLMGVMSGFFFVFRIVHPVAQRQLATPQRLISLDPQDPAALALIHRAQDRSFAVLADSDAGQLHETGLSGFRASFEGHRLRLLALQPAVAEVSQPQLLLPGMDVLPPLSPRVVAPVRVRPSARLFAVMSTSLAKRGPAKIELPGSIALTQPTRVQYRIAIGSAGQIVTALPLGITEDPAVMAQLSTAIQNLRFAPSEVKRIEWGEISFRWEAAPEP